MKSRRPAPLAVWLCLAGCGGGAAESPVGEHPAAARQAAVWSDTLEARGETLPPAGYGTLSQDDVTVPLEAEALLIKVVPLAEPVIRMTAPDTYRRLNGYKAARAAEILDAARRAGERRWPQVMFVTFFTREVEASFQPHDLQIRAQNTTFRSLGIVPITQDFGRGRLRQQETQIALYLFPADIDLELPLTVSYGRTENARWSGIRSRLDAELSRVLSRGGGDGSRD